MATGSDSLFFRRLEPLRGGRRSDAMSASQRARLLDAITRAVAEKGYAAVTVADVVGAAGVSRTTFYEQFASKEECFLAAYESGTGELLDAIGAAVAALGDNPPWEEILRTAMDTYLGMLSDHPGFARTFLIDVLGAGVEALEIRRGVFERFVGQYTFLAARTAEQEPELAPVPEIYLRALVGGISELLQQHILTRGPESLRELSPTLQRLVKALIRGAGDAGAQPPG